MIGLSHFLAVSLVVFLLGLFCVLTRRNAIGILMGVELILNAANINYVAFARYSSGGYDGQIFAIFVFLSGGLSQEIERDINEILSVMI